MLKLLPDFVELKLFKLMVEVASKTCGLHTFGPAWGGEEIDPSPPPLKTRLRHSFAIHVLTRDEFIGCYY